ncbi:aminoacyl-tRNA hydrolase [Desulfocurvus sp.]|jgi:PTH1 family peptidyl-tRNA hydrolase|uniref:aminoacyl-tRNA hydrolase n=1 Tax=Desulfocurvus sp. TaxID=2871698 RepID=UPI0025BC2CAB|nr:aminoacyl-tRNA hydrolase [Desulfocurvus sp.]MCK9240384.1 aminoacyl-tRNA hydrolase [Desulfocurvus sp.]
MKNYSALVAGLGNPGPEYELTRHNFGFLAIDALVEAAGGPGKCPALELRGDCPTRECRPVRNAAPLLLAKPQTYMNLSGLAVGRLAARLGLDPGEVIVLHDDLDLPLGRMKFKKGGSDAGHNGIKSVTEHLGTPNFLRLRLGIGRPEGRGGARDYVLEPFTREELEIVALVAQAAAKGLTLYLRRGFAHAVQYLNGFDARPGEKPDETWTNS